MKKLASILAVTLAAGVLATGCGSSSGSASKDSSSDSGKTVIKAATGANAKPYVYVGDDGKPAGYDVDVLNAVFDKLPDYELEYGVRFNVQPYAGTYPQQDALKLLKFERRVEMAMESERFFDLVRWGEAAEVLNKFYAEEANDCTIYSNALFTKNKNEYLPIPFAQMSASNGNYTQNCGGW